MYESEELYLDNHKDYFITMINYIIKRITKQSYDIKLNIGFDKNNNHLAYTDGKIITVFPSNCYCFFNCNDYKEKFLIMNGVLVHELGHIIWTNSTFMFNEINKINTVEQLKIFLNNNHNELIQDNLDIFLNYQVFDMIKKTIYKKIFNILEDAYIENILLGVLSNKSRKALQFLRSRHILFFDNYKCDPYTNDPKEKFVNLINFLLVYAKYKVSLDIISIDSQLETNIKKIADLYLFCSDDNEKLELIKECFILIFPFLLELIKNTNFSSKHQDEYLFQEAKRVHNSLFKNNKELLKDNRTIKDFSYQDIEISPMFENKKIKSTYPKSIKDIDFLEYPIKVNIEKINCNTNHSHKIYELNQFINKNKNFINKNYQILSDLFLGCFKNQSFQKNYVGKNLDCSKLITNEHRIFRTKNNKKSYEQDVAIVISIDLSGSMSNHIKQSLQAIVLLNELFSRFSIPIAITGYNEKEQANVFIIKDFYENKNLLINKISSLKCFGNNHDGSALKTNIQMLNNIRTKNKLLFMITDGLPNGTKYSGIKAILDIQQKIEDAKRNNINVVGICINKEIYTQVQQIYSNQSLLINNLNDLSNEFIKELIKIIKK